jgi:DnaK suppressor protein
MLTNEQIDEIRLRIEVELAAIFRSLKEGAADSMELDQTRVGRLSRMDAMQQQAMASGMKERLQIRSRRLEAALARIQSGAFGVCCQCGESISAGRLQVDPGGPFCAACQEEIDSRHKSA